VQHPPDVATEVKHDLVAKVVWDLRQPDSRIPLTAEPVAVQFQAVVTGHEGAGTVLLAATPYFVERTEDIQDSEMSGLWLTCA
jgi:hypothetical protein